MVSDGPLGGLVRYGVPNIGVAGVGASPPVRDALFPARRQAGGIRTAAALHNLGAEAMGVSCRLMSGGVALEEVEIPLEANGQMSWFIEDVFTATDTSDFLGSVRCTAHGRGRFTAIAVEMDAARRIFNTLSVVPVDRTGAETSRSTLNFAHFVNGTWITDLVFVNLETQPSRPAPTPFHTAILPSRPAIYFYDTEGNPIAAASVVDITGDLEISEDGALTVRTEMEPLGVLTISTHGRGELVTGSVRVVSEGPIGGMLRFEHPDLGVAGVGANPPVRDALFPVRRQEGGINTGVALHNLESSPGLVQCDLMREGVLLDAPVSILLGPNGQMSWLIDKAFPGADTSDFVGSVRLGRGCSPPWPWKWIPAAAFSPRCRWCRWKRGCLRNKACGPLVFGPERDILRGRVKAGIDQARKDGKPHGRPMTAGKLVGEIKQLRKDRLSKREIAKRLGVSRTAVIRLLRQVPLAPQRAIFTNGGETPVWPD